MKPLFCITLIKQSPEIGGQHERSVVHSLEYITRNINFGASFVHLNVRNETWYRRL